MILATSLYWYIVHALSLEYLERHDLVRTQICMTYPSSSAIDEAQVGLACLQYHVVAV
jgi:hypothetical protein